MTGKSKASEVSDRLIVSVQKKIEPGLEFLGCMDPKKFPVPDGWGRGMMYQVKLRKDSKIVTVHRCQFALDKTEELITDITNNAPHLNLMPKIEHALKEKQHFASTCARGTRSALHAAVAQGNLQLAEG